MKNIKNKIILTEEQFEAVKKIEEDEDWDTCLQKRILHEYGLGEKWNVPQNKVLDTIPLNIIIRITQKYEPYEMEYGDKQAKEKYINSIKNFYLDIDEHNTDEVFDYI